jgi:hypothetical protein
MALQLVPFQKQNAGSAFFLRIQAALAGGLEFLTIDHEDNVVLRLEMAQLASAMSLCNSIVKIIKMCDPTALIIVDIDAEAG